MSEDRNFLRSWCLLSFVLLSYIYLGKFSPMLMEKMNIMQSHTKNCKSFVWMFSHDSTLVTAKYHLIARGISLMPAQVFLNGNCQLIKLNCHSVTYNPHTKSKYINQNTVNSVSNYSQSNPRLPRLPRARTARPRQAV